MVVLPFMNIASRIMNWPKFITNFSSADLSCPSLLLKAEKSGVEKPSLLLALLYHGLGPEHPDLLT